LEDLSESEVNDDIDLIRDTESEDSSHFSYGNNKSINKYRADEFNRGRADLAATSKSPLSRRSIHPDDISIMQHFFNFLYALDKKYHISFFIVWAAVVILIIFALVFFLL